MLRLLEQARDGATSWRVACCSDDEETQQEAARVDADLATIESRIAQIKNFR